jgi:hypothetical protein
MTEKHSLTAAPVEIPPRVVRAEVTPEFVRLPRAGERCAYTGMSRSGLNALVLGPSAPVRSFVLRRPGTRTGTRLIDYASLIEFIRKSAEVMPASFRGEPQN